MERLERAFFKQSALEVAPQLLGKLLCRNVGGTVMTYRITQTEAYLGEEDTACHAHKGKTPRTRVMYGCGGVAYIYLCYGIHNLFNIVTGEENHPQAVLIRGVEGFDGPGKLTKEMGIDRSLNEEDLVSSDELWVADDGICPCFEASKRVGIAYATQEYQDKLWRFTVQRQVK